MAANKLMLIILLAVTLAITVIGLIIRKVMRPSGAKDRRKAFLKSDVRRVNAGEAEGVNRRKQVQDSLNETENRGKKKVSLETKLTQAGLTINKQTFIVASCLSAAGLGMLAFILLGRLYILPGALIGGFGLPNWTITHLREKRIKLFLKEFPTAIEVIIRGVKSGLPLGACLQTVASQAQQPVRGEFQFIVASTNVGLTVAESIERMAERVPIPETSFFAIVVNIQQKAGGNLTEALGNLSQVLRDRMTMQLKVKALSSEAKSSAWIIGMLPIIIGGLIYLIHPDYLQPLWTTPTGKMIMSGVVLWMSLGVFAMRQLVNFKP